VTQRLLGGRESLPIVAELSARFLAACRIDTGENSQQRKLSWLAPDACASISLRLALATPSEDF
jgi:hypothetical protein